MSSQPKQPSTEQPELYEQRLTEAQNALRANNTEQCFAILLRLIDDPNTKRVNPLVEARAHCIIAILYAYQAAHHKHEAVQSYEEAIAAKPEDRRARDGLEKARHDLAEAFREMAPMKTEGMGYGNYKVSTSLSVVDWDTDEEPQSS